jgi:hypothetical protein
MTCEPILKDNSPLAPDATIAIEVTVSALPLATVQIVAVPSVVVTSYRFTFIFITSDLKLT